MEFEFITKMYRVGTSYVVTVPKAFLTTMKKEKQYRFIIKEVENGKETGTPTD